MQRFTVIALTGLAAAGVMLFFIVPPIAQPQWYHDFADKRSLLGIPNFWNVVSNLPFLFVGGWGILYILRNGTGDGIQNKSDRWIYVVFFATVALTGIGSAYYHLEPNNGRLMWDRLPLAAMFMALFAIILAERVSRSLGLWLFVPLILLGAGTVLYWYLTEIVGRGDLRPYLMAQYYPVAAIAVILWLCPASTTKSENLYIAIAWYAGAKLYEMLDTNIYAVGQIISGHTLKHLGAAISCYMIFSWVRQRKSVIASTGETV
jgi:hypothetical protein